MKRRGAKRKRKRGVSQSRKARLDKLVAEAIVDCYDESEQVTGMRALFGPDALEQVARLVRAKRWGGTGRGQPENLRPGPGQVGAWGLKEAVFEQRAGHGLAPGLNPQQGP